MYFALPAFGLLALVHLGAQLFQPGGATASLTQPFLMPLLAMAMVARSLRMGARLDHRIVQLTLVALFFSWLGDSLPRGLDGDAAFLAMVGSFLVAQVVYAVAFWPRRALSIAGTRPWLVAPYVVAGIGLVWWCTEGAGSLLVPVIVYAAALVTMAVLATGLTSRGAVGGVLFLVSDALIAVDAFTGFDLAGHAFWVMLTYIAAQVLLVDAVLDVSASAEVSSPGTRRSG